MKTLYLPIHIPGTYHERSVANKRGLRDALARRGEAREIDYLTIPRDALYTTIRDEIARYQPDLLFLQLQGTDCLTPDHLRAFRRDFPEMAMVNWNGDYWPEHLTSPDMLALVHEVDLQLVVNGSVLDTYARKGVNAALCPFGFEPVAADDWHQATQRYDVLFLGNNYSPERQRLYDVLRSLPCKVGIYGAGWWQAEGECNYDFAMATSLYTRARLCISDNQFPDAIGYMSDRPIQIMYSGGLLIQQRVERLHELTGLQGGTHFVGFDTLDDLPALIQRWLDPAMERQRSVIALEGQRFVLKHHRWDNRVQMIVDELLPKVRAHAS